MSRVGKNPVPIPSGVTVDVKPQEVSVKGPKGNLTIPVRSEVKVSIDGDQVVVERSGSGADRQARALHGTTRALIANMITGVTTGFEKKLEIVGVGWNAKAQGKRLILNIGFCHEVPVDMPDGVEVETPGPNQNRVPRCRQPAGRPDRRCRPQGASAGALQGQGHSLRR